MSGRHKWTGTSCGLFWLFLGITAAISSHADPNHGDRAIRFQQILNFVGDANADNKIDDGELREFFKRRKAQILEIAATIEHPPSLVNQPMPKIDDPKFDDFLDDQAVDIVKKSRNEPIDPNHPAPVRFIDIGDFELLERAVLGPPLDVPAAKLLPESFSSPAASDGKADENLLDRVSEFVSVRRSFLDEKQIGRPATFSWSHFGADQTRDSGLKSTEHEFVGALTLEPSFAQFLHTWRAWAISGAPIAVYEADVSSGKKQDTDRIVHRLGLDAVLFQRKMTNALSAHNLKITFDYTTDSDYQVDVFGGTAQYSPNFREGGVGRYLRLGTPLAQLRWRPYMGLLVGHVSDSGHDAELAKAKSYTDGYARVGLEFMLFRPSS